MHQNFVGMTKRIAISDREGRDQQHEKTQEDETTPGGSAHGERTNFTGLVLGCIDASDSESRRIFQHFSRSTRFSILRTAPNSKSQQNVASFFHIFVKISQKFAKFAEILRSARCEGLKIL